MAVNLTYEDMLNGWPDQAMQHPDAPGNRHKHKLDGTPFAPPPEPDGPRPKSKYGAVRTPYNGVMYASGAEAERAKVNDLWVAGGRRRWWGRQPRFALGVPENVYIADGLVVEWSPLRGDPDFRGIPSAGLVGKYAEAIIAGFDRHEVHVEDVKGMWTAKFRRDVKLWRKYGSCPLWIIRGKKIDVIEGRVKPWHA